MERVATESPTYFVKARHMKRSISQKLLYVQHSNFDKIIRLPGSFNLRPVHMIPGVSQWKSYVYFYIRLLLLFFFFSILLTLRLVRKSLSDSIRNWCSSTYFLNPDAFACKSPVKTTAQEIRFPILSSRQIRRQVVACKPVLTECIKLEFISQRM